MRGTDKPRHIRDIAHIYLSRLQYSRPRTHDRLVICGESRDTFPAYHTAALAAGFALKRSASRAPLDVGVFDVSGVLPNVGYYFALPARSWLARAGGDMPESVTALAGVRLAFARRPDVSGGKGASMPRFEVHHIPPFEQRKAFRTALGELGRAAANTVFLLLARGSDALQEARAEAVSMLVKAPFCVLDVGGRGTFIEDGVGSVSAWESSLADRVPVMCRDPRTTLARRYDAVCEALICKIRANRRSYSGTVTERGSESRAAVRSDFG